MPNIKEVEEEIIHDTTDLDTVSGAVSKVALVTLSFWVMKIIATTLGETFGDFIAQTLNLGYIVGLAITGALLLVTLYFQITIKKFHPALFWAAIVATTTAGTEVSDLMDRTLGLGYTGGALVLATGLAVTLAVWYRKKGNLEVYPITRRDTEILFWIAVVFSNSLGTAFGDFLVDVAGFSFIQGAMICTAVIVAVMAMHYGKVMNDIALFWIAFIFTRPFGATFGDFLTKPVAKGGMELPTYYASIVCALLLAMFIAFQMSRAKAKRVASSNAA